MAQMTRADLIADAQRWRDRYDRLVEGVKTEARAMIDDGTVCADGANRHLANLGLDGVFIEGSVVVELTATLHFGQDQQFTDEDGVREAIQDWLDNLTEGDFDGFEYDQTGQPGIETV